VSLAAAAKAPIPSTLFRAETRVHTDGLGFEVFYPGAGHAADNVVVWFPDAGVLFGGCLVKAEPATDLGNVADADLASWPKAIAAVSERYPAIRWLVPGHGPVGGGAGALARTRALLQAAPRPTGSSTGTPSAPRSHPFATALLHGGAIQARSCDQEVVRRLP